MPNKALSLLGMARRAGKLTVGFDATVLSVRDRKAALAVFAADLSAKTEKNWRFEVQNEPIRIVRLTADKDQLGRAIGAAKPVGILTVCDKGFADTLRTYTDELGEDESL